jgi:hypothetical protein
MGGPATTGAGMNLEEEPQLQMRCSQLTPESTLDKDPIALGFYRLCIDMTFFGGGGVDHVTQLVVIFQYSPTM